MASARENDLNPDTKIGLELPFARSRTGLFGLTETTLEQAGHNIKNLLLTAKGERVMQPDFGSDLRALLFEQADENIEERIEETILESISTWLPYISVGKIDIIEDETNPNSMKVDLDFSLNPTNMSIGSILMGMGVALVAVNWTVGGWEYITFAAGEIKNPKNNLPLALIIGTIVILVLYFLINVAYLKVLPMGSLMGEIKVGETAARAIYGW